MKNRQVLFSALLSLGVRSFGAVAALIFSIFLTRKYGPDVSGLFFLTFSVFSLTAVFARVGLDNSLLRFIGSSSSAGEWSSVNDVMNKSLLLIFGTSALFSMLSYFFSDFLALDVFNDERLSEYFEVMSPFISLLAISTILAMGLQGRHRTLLSVLILNVSTNVLMVLFIFFGNVRASELPTFFMIASALTTLLALMFWFYKLPTANGSAIGWHVLFSSCLPLWLVMFVGQLIQWSGNIFLGIWSTPSEVALFTAAQRTAMLMIFVLTAINTVVAPKFAHLHKSQNHEQLASVAYYSARLLSVVSLPILIIMFVFPKEILSLFGEEFDNAAIYLQILALGQFVNAITGSVGYLLSMSGNEKDLRNSSIVSGLIVITLSLILVPLYGGLGAAISVAIAIAMQNLLAVHWVKKRLGINMLMAWANR
tara:strand:+ start:6564 stop:7835 length:1272 start_codon:yes stop_codon:yes gene_type:complete